ncbi:MAG: recombination mediator RecR [Sediminibacterium sp.]|nr:recombination mediator RecR [Sediminibacterium sp.]
MEFPSVILNDIIDNFSKLPGIGKKSALRMALFILKQEKEFCQKFSDSIINLKNNINFCTECGFLCDDLMCSYCSNSFRQKEYICVVESIREVLTIENTKQYSGLYHVLGGLISPIDGIGPDSLHIDKLIERVKNNEAKEVIFALSPTIQGDTTVFYIQQKLANLNCKITTISRGVSFGGEIEFVDELTLGKSIINRQPPQNYIV